MLNRPPWILGFVVLLQVLNTDAKMDIISSKQDFHVGEEILLLCKAGGEGDIMWQKDGEDVEDEDIVHKVDETSSKLIIKKALLQDSGRYTCKCEFDSGHQDDTQIVLYVYEGPSFGSTTTYHEFLEGTNGNVPCLVTGQPVVDVMWFRNKEEIPSNGMSRVRKLSDNTLFIENVRREDAGTYVCQSQIRNRPVTQQLPVSIVVNAPPVVRLKEEVKKVIAGPETNVSLLCLVDGLPKPNITWSLPVNFDPSHHHFNSDRSQLIINSVVRADYGEYVCTGTNKIAENSATFTLHVFEAPEVFVSADHQHVLVGESVSVTCNISGHPQPKLYWLDKQSGQILDSNSSRVHVVDGLLEIDSMMSSDGGLYSCMAVSPSGNASIDVAIYTQPGYPESLSVSPGPTSVLFSLESLPTSGGTPIKGFVLQWKQTPSDEWKEVIIPLSEPLAITKLKPYTVYTVRLAAMNDVGTSVFSAESKVRTEGISEPDSPVVPAGMMKVEGNTLSASISHGDDGGSPLLHFQVKYKQDAETVEWKEVKLQPDAKSLTLKDLVFGSDYLLEITAVNANGSSIPAVFNFTTAEKPVSSSLTKGSVVGIVLLIFLVVFLVVDATCCYRNRCGLLMSIAVKLFGQKVPGLKMLDGEEGAAKGEVTLKGLPTPRGSLQSAGTRTIQKEGNQLTEVTCDKAPLTKHEKTQLPSVDA